MGNDLFLYTGADFSNIFDNVYDNFSIFLGIFVLILMLGGTLHCF